MFCKKIVVSLFVVLGITQNVTASDVLSGSKKTELTAQYMCDNVTSELCGIDALYKDQREETRRYLREFSSDTIETEDSYIDTETIGYIDELSGITDEYDLKKILLAEIKFSGYYEKALAFGEKLQKMEDNAHLYSEVWNPRYQEYQRRLDAEKLIWEDPYKDAVLSWTEFGYSFYDSARLLKATVPASFSISKATFLAPYIKPIEAMTAKVQYVIGMEIAYQFVADLCPVTLDLIKKYSKGEASPSDVLNTLDKCNDILNKLKPYENSMGGRIVTAVLLIREMIQAVDEQLALTGLKNEYQNDIHLSNTLFHLQELIDSKILINCSKFVSFAANFLPPETFVGDIAGITSNLIQAFRNYDLKIRRLLLKDSLTSEYLRIYMHKVAINETLYASVMFDYFRKHSDAILPPETYDVAEIPEPGIVADEKLLFTLPAGGAIDSSYHITANSGESVSFRPHLTAKTVLECLEETEGTTVTWMIAYYDATQGYSAPRETLPVVLDREAQNFSFAMPSVQIHPVSLYYDTLDGKRASCGMAQMWEVESNENQSSTALRKVSWHLNGQKKSLIPEGISGTVLGLFTWWGDHSIKMDINSDGYFNYDFNENYPRTNVESQKINFTFSNGFSLQDYELWTGYWEDPVHGNVRCYSIGSDGTCRYNPYGAGAVFYVNEENNRFICDNNVWKYDGEPVSGEEIYCIEHEVNVKNYILNDLVFTGENYPDGTYVPLSFTKEWFFAEDLSVANLTINVLQNSYQNAITASDFTVAGSKLSVELQPNLSSSLNELFVQFTNSEGNIVKVSGSDTFWSLTKTNHAPRLVDGQIMQLVSATSDPATLEIETYDADGDVVTLSIEDSAGGTVSLNGNTLFASFSDGQVAHSIKVGLSDGTLKAVETFNVLQFDQSSLDSFYSDVDKNTGDYVYDGIAFGTLKGVIWGQPDPDDSTKRIFRPTDPASWAETLAMVINAQRKAGQITLQTENLYQQVYPEWAMPYYSFALEKGGLDSEIADLSQIYPTREQIAKLIVKTMDLEENLRPFDLNVTFNDASDFSDEAMLYYAKIVHVMGLFMDHTSAHPQSTINRAELSMVIEKIFMVPTADIVIDPQSVRYGDTFNVSLVNVHAETIDATDFSLYDASSQLQAFYVSNGAVRSNPINSLDLDMTLETLSAVLDNNGVRNVVSIPVTIYFYDQDGDGVEDREDKWINDPRYTFDANANNIPDILDNIYGLGAYTSSDSVIINDTTIAIEDIIHDGWVISDLDGDGLSDVDDSDIDGDGYSNINEYACGSNPWDETSRCSRGMPWLILLLEED